MVTEEVLHESVGAAAIENNFAGADVHGGVASFCIGRTMTKCIRRCWCVGVLDWGTRCQALVNVMDLALSLQVLYFMDSLFCLQ